MDYRIRSFLKGIGSIFDLFGYSSRFPEHLKFHVRSDSEARRADYEALKGDWERVESDFKNTMKKVRREFRR